VRWTACMLTGKPGFVMSSVGLFKCRQTPHRAVALFTVQIASPQNAIIAICNATPSQRQVNSLFLKDLIAVKLLARGLLQLFSRTTEVSLMNRALLLSNAIALAVLAGFHFAPENSAVQVAQRMPHYLQLQKAPQLAVMSDQGGFIRQDVSQEGPSLSQASERFVF